MADVLIRQANINDVDAIFEIEHLWIPGARILCGMSWGKIRGHFIL